MKNKLIIYQVLPRLFGNRNITRKPNATLGENGSGKLNDFDGQRLRQIKDMGVSHIWYTGIIRHASTTDYSSFGIPCQHASIVKGKAGSPYAITDYYDVDPDLAVDVNCRMNEFENLIKRTHEAGMKVIIDFVPNHVAREYHSIASPIGVKALGEDDNTDKHFDAQNNFYYCPGEPFVSPVATPSLDESYQEFPAKCTGNDRFDNHPNINDWYETVKLNYGIDYCDAGGRSYHFIPVRDTWNKMTDILLFWAGKGVDGFRCDMAEMVPSAFWLHATTIVKEQYPDLLFIGEVYDTAQYRTYISSGFDYLYDKVGMYDCLRDVVCGHRPANAITYCWQSVDDIKDHMLYFLENHDEQRIASDFFCSDSFAAIPALIVSALLQKNPFMLYAGQEFGERGMDTEGFSGYDGRTTIFDYWMVDSLYRGFFDRRHLTMAEKQLMGIYNLVLNIASHEKAVVEGDFFDLMYVNPYTDKFNPRTEYAFLRKKDSDVMLVISNFSGDTLQTEVVIPEHAFTTLGLPEGVFQARDLLANEQFSLNLRKDGAIDVELKPYSGRIIKFNTYMNGENIILNDHNKEEFAPAHTAEHLLNQVMVRMFGCARSHNAHIERKKSKMSFVLDHKPTRQEEKAIEERMNELIEEDLPVTFEFVNRNQVPENISLERLPDDASEMLRLVHIGDFDVCLCVGKHVRSTSQIGRFEMLGTNWNGEKREFRIRFKVHP